MVRRAIPDYTKQNCAASGTCRHLSMVTQQRRRENGYGSLALFSRSLARVSLVSARRSSLTSLIRGWAPRPAALDSPTVPDGLPAAVIMLPLASTATLERCVKFLIELSNNSSSSRAATRFRSDAITFSWSSARRLESSKHFEAVAFMPHLSPLPRFLG